MGGCRQPAFLAWPHLQASLAVAWFGDPLCLELEAKLVDVVTRPSTHILFQFRDHQC